MANPTRRYFGSIFICLAAALFSSSMYATSARLIYPELVGVRAVWLNLNIFKFSGSDVPELESAIRARLLKAGIAVAESEPIHLFVKASYIQSPTCVDVLAVRVHVAVSEDARVVRPGRNPAVWVDSWKVDDEFLVSTAEAWGRVRESILGTIDYLLESREYTSSLGK